MVTDTDDGVSEVVTYYQISEAIHSGLDIKGVQYKRLNGATSIGLIDVYQPTSSVTTQQRKAKFLNGLDIKVNNGEIVFIEWDDKILRPGTRIRLSDYATKCADHILSYRTHQNKVEPVFVLDDKIRIRKGTFLDVMDVKCKLDMSEVTNPKTLKFVYDEYLMNGGAGRNIAPLFIDIPERLELVAAYGVVLHNRNPDGYKFSAKTTAFIEDKFYDTFEKLADSPLHFASSDDARIEAIEYYRRLDRHLKFWKSKSSNYFAVRVHDDLTFFEVACRISMHNPQLIMEFLAFMYYFEPSERIQELYVRFCNKFNTWVLDLHDTLDWR